MSKVVSFVLSIVCFFVSKENKDGKEFDGVVKGKRTITV